MEHIQKKNDFFYYANLSIHFLNRIEMEKYSE